MNTRIKKKRQQLSKMHASNYKDVKLNKKRACANYIEARHRQFRLIPEKDGYAKFLKKRRCYGKIEPDILLAMTCLMTYESDRKVAKEKLFVKVGEYNPERKPSSDEFVPWRMMCDEEE